MATIEYPARHWELDENRQPSQSEIGSTAAGRRILRSPAAAKREASGAHWKPPIDLRCRQTVDGDRYAHRPLFSMYADRTADEDGQQYELMRMIESVRHNRRRMAPAAARLVKQADCVSMI